MGTAANQLAQLQQQDALAQTLIQTQAVEMTTQIFSTTVVPANQNVINVPVRNVGLIKGFWVECQATVTGTGSASFTPTDFAAANLLSQITFTDLNNNVRIQTTGWHLEMVNTAKAKRIFGSATPDITGNDSPMNYGSNWNVISQTATVTATGTGSVRMKYWVPIAYSDTDYRGAIWANVINATMNLQLTVNTNAVVLSSIDTTNAVYSGAAGAAGSITSFTVSVSQVFMDQVPTANGVAILPPIALSTVYELKNTNFAPVNVSQDFPMQYANFRQFLSTIAVYYNGSARTSGADVNYWTLQSANYTNIWKRGPNLQALIARNIIGSDFPPGVYYFSSRNRPISTTQYGNMQLVLNASTATSPSYVNVGYEDFALVNTISQAGSLASS